MSATYTYTGDPATVPADAVRFWAGDTDTTNAELTDGEITYLLALQPNDSRLAAAAGLDAVASRYAKRASFTVGSVSKQMGDRSDMLRKRAIDLRNEAGKLAQPFFGGQSQAGKDDLGKDADAVQPHFAARQFDNPLARQFDGQAPDPLVSGV